VVVHGHWKPCYTLNGVVHALCNAHHLRELKALVEIEKEEWAHRMQHLLRRACHAANLAREQDVLRFLIDPGVPFANNLAERDGRMLEPRSGSRLRQKISGGFRLEDGATDLAAICSVLSTACKQGGICSNPGRRSAAVSLTARIRRRIV
jgi:hypothetical protein